jgi:hypothetical protein
MNNRYLFTGLIVAVLILSLLGSCTGQTTRTGTTTTPGQGKIQVYVTDAPAENITAIVIQASSIEAHLAGDNASGWITLLENPPAFDLLQIAGIQSLLGTANVTSGNYTQVRVAITEVTVTINGEQKKAAVPSDKLKFVGNITVAAGAVTSISLDFDAGKSIVVKGNGEVSLKPVVKLLISKPDSSLEDPTTGTLTPSEPL